MFKYIKLILLFGVLFTACSRTNNRPVTIRFSADSSKVVIADLNEASLLQLKNNLPTDSSYQYLVTVLQTPADQDSTSMEVEWPGKLSLDGKTLLFTPDQPFIKGHYYLIETMLTARFADVDDIVRAEVGHQVKPQQQLLKR